MTSEASRFYVPGFMDLSAYRLERAELDDAWDRFVEASPQGTLFSQSEFLRASQLKPSLWHCLKDRELVAAVSLAEAPDGTGCIHRGFLIYGGIMFAPADPNRNAAQRRSEEFRITSAVVRDLAERYQVIEMATHPAFVDIRPFQWFNYGSEGPHFEVVNRFTSLVSLGGVADGAPLEENPAYLACNKSRRQEIRYARKAGVETEERFEPDAFRDLYRQTFEAQGIALPDEELGQVLDAIAALRESGRLKMFVSRPPGADIGSVAVFGVDSKRAYYLYGAGSGEGRSGHAGTAVLWDAFQELARSGVAEVDMEGINSPRRGYFKLSFGGSITPYHLLKIDAR